MKEKKILQIANLPLVKAGLRDLLKYILWNKSSGHQLFKLQFLVLCFLCFG